MDETLEQVVENNISRIKNEVRAKEEEMRTLRRECELLEGESYKYMDIRDLMKKTTP